MAERFTKQDLIEFYKNRYKGPMTIKILLKERSGYVVEALQGSKSYYNVVIMNDNGIHHIITMPTPKDAKTYLAKLKH